MREVSGRQEESAQMQEPWTLESGPNDTLLYYERLPTASFPIFPTRRRPWDHTRDKGTIGKENGSSHVLNGTSHVLNNVNNDAPVCCN